MINNILCIIILDIKALIIYNNRNIFKIYYAFI